MNAPGIVHLEVTIKRPFVIFITVHFLFLTGNHDYVPDNQLPAEANQIYRNLTDQWENLGWFNGDANNKETFSKCEYMLRNVSMVQVLGISC